MNGDLIAIWLMLWLASPAPWFRVRHTEYYTQNEWFVVRQPLENPRDLTSVEFKILGLSRLPYQEVLTVLHRANEVVKLSRPGHQWSYNELSRNFFSGCNILQNNMKGSGRPRVKQYINSTRFRLWQIVRKLSMAWSPQTHGGRQTLARDKRPLTLTNLSGLRTNWFERGDLRVHRQVPQVKAELEDRLLPDFNVVKGGKQQGQPCWSDFKCY